ncbi:Methyl-accepting chemotaxis protein [Desulfurella amilsii]|uniref:Methyl-accepting chemotaxis protein n=1 Tax=Desulfurella amilsii TaxID=1562698 RepID=A0A1X4XWY1_9BACT|nr:methyl-accepting chemotaxis protein [Desulfurella amilsii]OSS42041.1 Methyl-accepting chemotaxis protein [Desulfurella amilsii]
MVKKLASFTILTFILYFVGGILAYALLGSFVQMYFVYTFSAATLIFGLVNFWYYYVLIIKPTKQTADEFCKITKSDVYDLTKDYSVPGFCTSLGKFINTLVSFSKSIFSELITNATKTSVFNAKFNFELKNITHHMNETKDNLEAINKTMNDSTKAIGDISHNMEDFVRFMEEVNAISEQTIKTTQNISKTSQNSIEVLNENKQSMESLHAQIDDILSIVNIINDIANQTNLLALNAAIEAARAGEHGRGFAVVADEIRKLAEQTQKQSKEIENTINSVADNFNILVERNKAIRSTIEQNTKSVEEMLVSFDNLAQKINQANNMINTITAATEEQSSSIEEVAQTVEYLANSVKEISNSLDNVSSKSLDLSKIAEQSANILKKVKVGNPLETIVELANKCAKEMTNTIENAVKKGIISSSGIWDRNYAPVSNTNPQKYRTQFTDFFKQHIQPIEDKYLSINPNFRYVLFTDNNGYVASHNSIYDKPLTGSYEKDLAGNRSMRIFNDLVGLNVARNTDSLIIQTYPRDTGEIISDIGVPVFIEGKHWGGIRIGLAVENM